MLPRGHQSSCDVETLKGQVVGYGRLTKNKYDSMRTSCSSVGLTVETESPERLLITRYV